MSSSLSPFFQNDPNTLYYPIILPKGSEGRLPNDVRTALMKSEAKEMELLANLLLKNKVTDLPNVFSSRD